MCPSESSIFRSTPSLYANKVILGVFSTGLLYSSCISVERIAASLSDDNRLIVSDDDEQTGGSSPLLDPNHFVLYFTIRAQNVSLRPCFQKYFFNLYTPGLVLLFYIKIFVAGFTTPFYCKSSLLAQFAAFIVLSIQTCIVVFLHS